MTAPQHRVAIGSASEDEFVWLEDESPETLAWQEQQDAATLRVLDGWPHREQLHALLESLPPSRGGHVPRFCGGAMFSVTSSGLEVNGALILDLSTAGETLANFWPSPDGRHVAVATTAGSAEVGELRLLHSAGGSAMAPPLLYTDWSRLSWLPDSTGFYVNGIDLVEGQARGALWFQGVSAPAAVKVDLPHTGFDLYPAASVDGHHVMVSTGIGALRPAFLLSRNTQEVTPFITELQEHVQGIVVSDRYIAVTTVGADRGRVVSIPLASPRDASTWREVLPEGDAVMRALSIVDGHLVVSELLHGCSRIRITTLDGAEVRTVPLPNGGVGVATGGGVPLPGVPMIQSSPGSSVVTFRYSSPAAAPASYAFDILSGELQLIDGDPGGMSVRSWLTTARAADGTNLPAWVTRPALLDPASSVPTVVVVYGGWNLANSPEYKVFTAAILACGGQVVHAIVRGGGEGGDAWWHGGRRERKQTTFDDLYTIVEHLTGAGIAEPGRVALQGASAGGLASAVAATQRPDLFVAVAATAPLLDLLRAGSGPKRDDSTLKSIHEELTDDPNVLSTYSPYHHIHDHLPAMFVGATADDVRTPAWHARKFVARAQHVGQHHPVLLRAWRDAGHVIRTPGGSQINHDWLTFVMRELDLTPPAANSR